MNFDSEIEKMWVKFSDVMIEEDEAIGEDFFHFERGSYKYEIWSWFDKNHSKGVYWLMCNSN